MICLWHDTMPSLKPDQKDTVRQRGEELKERSSVGTRDLVGTPLQLEHPWKGLCDSDHTR